MQAHDAANQAEQRLPVLGTAPDFALTSQDGEEVTLQSLRGKVVAVSFIYNWCPDVCPMLADKMARVQDALLLKGFARPVSAHRIARLATG